MTNILLDLSITIFSFSSSDALRLAVGNNECSLHKQSANIQLEQESQKNPEIYFEKALSCMGKTGSMSSVFRKAEKGPEDLEEGVLVFVPGASDTRIANVKKTIAWLRDQKIPTECIVYKYQELSISDDELSPCKVMDNKGQKWMDHILQVPLNMTKKKYVLHVMDGVRTQGIDVARMIKSMVDNDLEHVSPALYGKYLYPPMLPHLGFGRKVNFIEYHMNLMARSNFACLQDIVDSKHTIDGQRTTENHFGWWVDIVMPYVCRGGMGVIDAMKMFKYAGGTYHMKKAVNEARHWSNENGWGELKQDLRETLGPLKGDLLPGDPQCDGPRNIQHRVHRHLPEANSCIWRDDFPEEH